MVISKAEAKKRFNKRIKQDARSHMENVKRRFLERYSENAANNKPIR